MERVDADLVPFAQNNPSGYRFAFGTDTATDDINVNYNDNIKKGWGTTPNEFPEVEDFNAFAYTSGYLTAYLYQMGIAEWNNKQKYKKYSRVIGSDGKIYKAKEGTDLAPNVNNNPTTDTTNWEDVLGNYVATTGNQTIAGIKTFTSSPIVPTPTADTQAANKGYVDSKPTLPIGIILNGYTILDNCIVAFGGEFNRADYPNLWTYLEEKPSLIKTQAQWQTEATENGGICGFFSSGNGTTTFRVPNLDKAFLRPDSRGAGSFEEGSYLAGDGSGAADTSNAIGLINYDSNLSLFRSRMNWDSLVPPKIGSANLLLAGASTATLVSHNSAPELFGVARPKNIAVLPLIVAK